jgi:hypothetical protein
MMDVCMDGWMDVWMDGWMCGCVDVWMDGCMDEWAMFLLKFHSSHERRSKF